MTFEIVPFQNDQLEALRDGADVWVSLRRMCEALGVDMKSQHRKLAAQPWAVMVMKTTTGPDGKTYATSCLHLDSVPMWLATIAPSRVAEPVRAKLRGYQVECARVLRDHFFGPRAGGVVASGGARGSGGMPAMSQVFKAMMKVAELAEENAAALVKLEERVTTIENARKVLPIPTELRLESVRKAYDVDVRGNVRRLHGDDPDGAHNRSANSFLKYRLGKKRKNWLERDYVVACEVAEAELRFTMTSCRALLPDLRDRMRSE